MRKTEKIILLILSCFLFPFFSLTILLKKKVKKTPRFLVIDTAKIGDIVCSTSFFRAIKKNFPNSFLTALVISRVEPILRNNPNIDEIILIDKYKGIRGFLKLIRLIRKKNFDCSFKLRTGGHEDLIPLWAKISCRITTVSRYAGKMSKLFSRFSKFKKEYNYNELKSKHNLDLLKFLGIKEEQDKIEVFYTEKEKLKVYEIFRERNIFEKDLLVGISVTAGNKFKEWEPEKFGKLADKIIKHFKAKVLFLGSKKDKEIVKKIMSAMKERAINLSGLIDLTTLPAVIHRLDLFISVDTGPLYVAVALDVPVIDINGPFNVREQMHSDSRAEIVENKIYCQPCSHLVNARTFCKEAHHQCIKGISVEKVFQAVKKIIEKYKII